jgi:superoxide dismutase, Cu-Zn family
MRFSTQALTAASLLAAGFAAQAESIQVQMQMVDANGIGKSIGTVMISSAGEGVTFTPRLAGLPPGAHGFHIHEKPSCDPAVDPVKGQVAPAQAAGGHLDPAKSGRHEGPAGSGHLGDLPALKVDNSGNATAPVVAPRLKLPDLAGHALMIHAGGDTYSDTPEKLGGGGARIACGIINP